MQWHDLLGAVLIDFFDGSPYVVNTEVDLSLRKQHLDIVVIRKNEGEFRRRLPDGLAPLANHNLISFKSHQDTFDAGSLLELIGYYVNYRKQASSFPDPLLPEDQFRLFGISSRFPDNLARQFPLEEIQSGVYDITIGPLRIRLLVIRNLTNEPANALLKFFSAAPEQIEFACRQYRPLSPHTTGIVQNMIRIYRKEDKNMATTLEELNRKLIDEASVDERLRGLTTEQILKGLSLEERLKGLSPDEIEAYLRTVKKKKPRKK